MCVLHEGSHVNKCIPQHWVHFQSPEQWEAEVMHVHKQLAGLTMSDAQCHYVIYLKHRPVFGSMFFEVQQRGQFKELPQDLIAAINCNGLHLLNQDTTKVRNLSCSSASLLL